MAYNDQKQQQDGDLQEKLVQVNRVAKVVKGGRIFSFTAFNRVAAIFLHEIRSGSQRANPTLNPIISLPGTFRYPVLRKYLLHLRIRACEVPGDAIRYMTVFISYRRWKWQPFLMSPC